MKLILPALSLVEPHARLIWWGKPNKVYVYSFFVVRKFKPPLPFKKPKGVQVWIRKLKIEIPEKV